MSGLTGWVDYERDLRDNSSTLLWMTGALACRGPDGEGLWTGQHAAVGCRTLDTVGEKRAYPVRVTDNGTLLAVAAHSGTVLNYRELRQELIARGHRFTTASDGEVLARAYLQWGEAFCEHVAGPFGVAIWDEREQALILARDRMGVQPMFYATTATGVVFGSTMTAVLSHPLVSSAVDADGLREVLSYAGTPGITAFRDVRKVRSGHLVRVDRAGTREIRYWRLTTQEHGDDLDKSVAQVRRHLEDSVRLHLTGDVPMCVMLSGGLDSSAITALVAAELRRGGSGPVRTFSVGFAGHAENFRPDDQRSVPDAPYVAEVVSALGAEHSNVIVNAAELIDPVVRHEVLRAKEIPTPFGDMNTSAYLLARAARTQAKVALLGEGADSIFGGLSWQHDMATARSGTFPWVAIGEQRGHWAGLGCGLLDEDLLRRLDLPGYTRARFAEAVAEVEHMPGAPRDERLMRELNYVGITRLAENQNNHVEATGQALGLEVRTPFWHHELVQYVYNTSWAIQTHDGREKSLLRAAVADLVPDSVLRRQKSPYPVTQDHAYDRALRGELSELLEDRDAPVRPLMDNAAAQRVLDDPQSMAKGWLSRTNVEMALQLNEWLRAHGVRLDA